MKLTVVSTHPVQYYAPLLRRLAVERGLALRVFYLWDFGAVERHDPGFGRAVRWDLDLLQGYDHEFVPNRARDPGTHHFWGIDNPALPARVAAFGPDAVLLIGYHHASFLRLLFSPQLWRCKFLLRGDSHRLVPRRGAKAALRRALLTLLFQRFDAFLPVGAANRRYFQEHGVPERKLFFAPHAVDNDRFTAAGELAREEARAWRRELGVPEHHRVVLFAGKFEEKKRPQDLLRAFRQAGRPDATLLLVGDGALGGLLRQEVEGLPNVRLAPFQNQSRMPRTYAAADVVVLPSLGEGETWGLCVNEAMCLGKPVIVSSHVGCAEDLVKPGVNGLVFPAGDVAALTACLREALADPDRLARWGQEGRRVVERYSYEQAVAGLRRALEWLLPGQ